MDYDAIYKEVTGAAPAVDYDALALDSGGVADVQEMQPTLPTRTPAVGGIAGDVAKSVKPAFQEAIGKYQSSLGKVRRGDIGMGAHVLRTFGAGAGVLGDVGGKVIESTFTNVVPQEARQRLGRGVTNIAQSELGQRFGRGITNIAQSEIGQRFGRGAVRLAGGGEEGKENLRAIGEIASVIPVEAVASAGIKATKTGIRAAKPVIQQSLRGMKTFQATKQASKNILRTAKSINKVQDEIAAIEGVYAKTRKANRFSKDAGDASRRRIAESGVLEGSTDRDGLVRTLKEGGAIEKYKAMTVDPAEGVVRKNLEKLGEKVNLKEVEQAIIRSINDSGAQGEELISSLNKVKKEIAGFRLRADKDGNIPLTLIHDAKIRATKGINYLTPAETAAYKKSVARALKETVENKSKFNVKEINEELSAYYDDIARLERLDGARVKGGRLGKYVGQVSGNVIGAAAGTAIGGPLGGALGTILGGEVLGRVKGVSMSKAFRGGGKGIKRSQMLEEAIQKAKP